MEKQDMFCSLNCLEKEWRSHPCIKDPLNRTRLCNIRKTHLVNESRKMRIMCVLARHAWVHLPYLTCRCWNSILWSPKPNHNIFQKPNQMWVNVVYRPLIYVVCCFLIKGKMCQNIWLQMRHFGASLIQTPYCNCYTCHHNCNMIFLCISKESPLSAPAHGAKMQSPLCSEKHL